MFKLVIHKGTNEIGGSCVELSTENTTILIDYGSVLDETSTPAKIDKKIDAILLSHSHIDHFGEIKNIPNIPIYSSPITKELIKITSIFVTKDEIKNNFHFFKPKKSFEIGDFTITPYPTDHSAIDSFAFLIEAKGVKVLYSGDFRNNGRKNYLFNNLLKEKKLKNIDYLLLEGTLISRDSYQKTEQALENEMIKVLKDDKLALLISSSQNIDRLVTAYRSAIQSGRDFVVDIYTALILDKAKLVSKNLPKIEWDRVKVYNNPNQFEKIEKYYPKFLNLLKCNFEARDNILKNPSKYLLKIPNYQIKFDEANIIYSQWKGYIQKDETLQKLKQKHTFHYIHTSGHANIKTLKEFVEKINPKRVIPIHTEEKHKFKEIFPNTMILEDNEILDVVNQTLSKYDVDELNQIFGDKND